MAKDPETDEVYPVDVFEDWRRAEFLEMGFTVYQAEVLLHTLVQVSTVRESLIRKGCSAELAWRILRPDGCPEDPD